MRIARQCIAPWKRVCRVLLRAAVSCIYLMCTRTCASSPHTLRCSTLCRCTLLGCAALAAELDAGLDPHAILLHTPILQAQASAATSRAAGRASAIVGAVNVLPPPAPGADVEARQDDDAELEYTAFQALVEQAFERRGRHAGVMACAGADRERRDSSLSVEREERGAVAAGDKDEAVAIFYSNVHAAISSPLPPRTHAARTSSGPLEPDTSLHVSSV